ncbi:hotdog fold thioesterase [Compostibacter hankyongensis]|uniref:Hotdog fold thioesterase n=1 Tax=Compostibacter hankyongensis TaxID=1007089 RepID=A0ABP8G7E0_9BACT
MHHTIWHSLDISLDALNERNAGTMADFLGIEFTEIGNNYLRATMPVNERTLQPRGILHGGAAAALIETIGSVASSMVIDPGVFVCAGIAVNANHVRSVGKGFVHAVATALHIGSSTHVWEVRVKDDEDALISAGRLTVAVLRKNK